MKRILTLLVGCFSLALSAQTVPVTFNLNTEFEDQSTGFFLAGGAFFGNPGDNPLTDDDGDMIWTITMDLPVESSSFYIFTKGVCPDFSCKELIAGQECAFPEHFNDRGLIIGSTAFEVATCWEQCSTDGVCQEPVMTEQVAINFICDMRCADTEERPPAVVGPSFGWCDGCNPMSDEDGDDIWELELLLDVGSLEYKYQANGWAAQENLVDDSVAGAFCAPITNFIDFANRVIEVPVGGATVEDSYGSCEACDGQGDARVAVNFVCDMTCADTDERPPAVVGPSFGWCDGCNPMTDDDGDDIWELELLLDIGSLEYKYQANGWAAQENLIDDAVAGATCAPLTDFTEFANRVIEVTAGGASVEDSYGSCAACGGEVIGTGIDRVNDLAKIYPSVVSDVLYLSDLNTEVDLNVFSVSGKSIYHAVVSGDGQIDCGNYAEGIYFVELVENNKKQLTRFVVKH